MSCIMATPESTEQVGCINFCSSGEENPSWDVRVLTPEGETIANATNVTVHYLMTDGTIRAEIEFMPPVGSYITRGPEGAVTTFTGISESSGFLKVYDNVGISYGAPIEA